MSADCQKVSLTPIKQGKNTIAPTMEPLSAKYPFFSFGSMYSGILATIVATDANITQDI